MARYVDAWMREQLPYDEDHGSAFEVVEDWDEYVSGQSTISSLAERNERIAAWRKNGMKGPKPQREDLADHEEMSKLADMMSALNPSMGGSS